MSLVVGQRMVRTDDGMRGVVELVEMPGFEQYQETRIVYVDRGEKRIAGKREVWEPEKEPSRKLRDEEALFVACWADAVFEAIEKNQPFRFWESVKLDRTQHDPELVKLIIDHLRKRG